MSMAEKNAGMNLVRNAGMSQDRCVNKFLGKTASRFPSRTVEPSLFPILIMNLKRFVKRFPTRCAIKFPSKTAKMFQGQFATKYPNKNVTLNIEKIAKLNTSR